MKSQFAFKIASFVYRNPSHVRRRWDPLPDDMSDCTWKQCVSYGWYVVRNLFDHFKMSGTDVQAILDETSGDLDMFYFVIDGIIAKYIEQNNQNPNQSPMIPNYKIYKKPFTAIGKLKKPKP